MGAYALILIRIRNHPTSYTRRMYGSIPVVRDGGGITRFTGRVYGGPSITGDKSEGLLQRMYAGQILENAFVCDNPKLGDRATVKGSAVVCEHARISGTSLIQGKALIHGNTCVSGASILEGDVTISSGWIKDVHWWREVP